MSDIYLKLQESVAAIKSRIKIEPKVGIVLGSGLGAVADAIQDAIVIPYKDIPHFHGTNVEGHLGRLIVGKLGGAQVACLQGRVHFYEGYSMDEVVYPTRTLGALGIHTLILTNAAGAVNTKFRPCDLMLIEDHLNLMWNNPLLGPNLREFGPRFPDLTEAWNPQCKHFLTNAAEKVGLSLHRGVYAALLGPTYETPAEVRMLRTLGADAVGMSTVPESIAANHLGLRVCGVSCITNMSAGITPNKLSHQEVIENGSLGAKKIALLLEAAAPHLTAKGNL